MKIISMTDFVLEQNYTTTLDISQIDFYDKELSVLSKIRNYANFLKQPLKLEMLFPCDEDGNFLFNPKWDELQPSEYYHDYLDELDKYQQAKEKVLFEEKINMPKNIREFMNWIDYNKLNIIEDIIDYNLTLTQKAIKQLGL